MKFSVEDKSDYRIIKSKSGNIVFGFTKAFPDFNLGMNTDKMSANNNWRIFLKSNQIDKIFLPIQVHSNSVVKIDNINDSRFYCQKCDGYSIKYANDKRCMASVTVADCIPVLFYSNNYLGAVHAGWRGLYNGIIENTIRHILCDESLDDYVWIIGPHARECCYEISKELYNKFKSKYLINPGKVIKNSNENKYFLSLDRIINHILKSNGVNMENIINSNICTICNTDYYSYRRDNKNSGRFAGFIYNT